MHKIKWNLVGVRKILKKEKMERTKERVRVGSKKQQLTQNTHARLDFTYLAPSISPKQNPLINLFVTPSPVTISAPPPCQINHLLPAFLRNSPQVNLRGAQFSRLLFRSWSWIHRCFSASLFIPCALTETSELDSKCQSHHCVLLQLPLQLISQFKVYILTYGVDIGITSPIMNFTFEWSCVCHEGTFPPNIIRYVQRNLQTAIV